jgi:hypothetical protein
VDKKELIQAIVDAQHHAEGFIGMTFAEIGAQFEEGQDIAPANHEAAVRLYRIKFAEALEAAAKDLREVDSDASS